jgi:HSF-type DNA-binding
MSDCLAFDRGSQSVGCANSSAHENRSSFTRRSHRVIRRRMSTTSETGGEVPKPIATTTMSEYRDYSQATAESVAAEADNAAAAHQEHRALVVSDQNFPVKLHYVLHEFEDDGLSHIVSWAPHGRSFIVHKHELFVETILCRYVVCCCCCFDLFGRSGLPLRISFVRCCQLVSTIKVCIVSATA